MEPVINTHNHNNSITLCNTRSNPTTYSTYLK